MASEAVNDGQRVKRRNPKNLAGEIGLWLSIAMLLVSAAIHGFSDISKIKGDLATVASLETWAQTTLWMAVPIAVVSALLFVTTRSTSGTEDEATAS